MRFIGDVHGKMDQYLKIIDCDDATIQVGDFGAGFVPLPALSSKDRFIRGNHDNPEVCRNHPNWIPDGTIENDAMFVGGAVSVDRDQRTEGVDWWRDEELTINELYETYDAYALVKPRIMVTHECPNSIAELIKPGSTKHHMGSRTRQCFQSMLELHAPEYWIFGHWHYGVDEIVHGTRFICLAELQWIDLPIL